MADSCPQVSQQLDGFSCSLETDKPKYEPGEPVELTFHLTNNKAEDMYVLKWHTPLEGVRNNFLTITVDGAGVRYQGIMVKRGNPGAESYILVRAGQCVSATVDLHKGYSTDTPGHYFVEMEPNLLDVITKTDDVVFKPRTLDEMTMVDMVCKPVEFDVVASVHLCVTIKSTLVKSTLASCF